MLFLILANFVVLIHGLFILFAITGGLIAWRWPKLIYLHIPALLWGLWIEVSHGICPLTHLEKQFRHLAGESGYDKGFIEHYLLPIIYPAELTHETQYVLATLLAGINLFTYVTLVKQHSDKNRLH